MDTQKIIVCLSGGMDSATLLGMARHYENEVVAISFLYGQRHRKELEAARVLAEWYGVEHQVLDLRKADVFSGSALTSSDIEVPEGHYEAESMKATVVPNRNMVFLSLATALAISRGFDKVGYAAHSGDHAIYPDCRIDFINAMRTAIALASSDTIQLWTPFDAFAKADIARLGKTIGVPYHRTWSCYKGEDLHCGKCGTCVERLEAFEKAGYSDEVEYQTFKVLDKIF